MKRWKYDSLDVGQLRDGDFAIDLEPGQEFDAPDTFVPSPDPHPVFKPVNSKPSKSPQPQE